MEILEGNSINIIREFHSSAFMACCDVTSIGANVEGSIRSLLALYSVRDCLQLELVLLSQAGLRAAVLNYNPSAVQITAG